MSAGRLPPMPRRGRAVARAAAAGLCVLAAAVCGCGYVVGDGFSRDARTIHVPMFTSDSFRRGQGERLTEAVHKQIQQRTPYRLVTGSMPADTRLVGHIREVRKDVLTETQFDDVRELQLLYGVELRWEDLRTGQILATRTVPLTGGATALVADATFAPEVGQSLATAEQQALDDLAREIVNIMEVPW